MLVVTDDDRTPPPPPSPRPPVDARTPVRFTGLTIHARPNSAGGLTAVRSALHHLSEAGLGRVGGTLALRRMNQRDGFDCPGCAWPDPDEKRSFLGEYCENGAKAFAEEATTARADAAFFEARSLEELRRLTDHELGRSGRLVEPLLRDAGDDRYRRIGWDEALALVAEELATTRLLSPHRAVFYTSGRASNEAAFLYQLLVRRYGTNNLPDCSNMCHESSGCGLGETIGIGKGTVTLHDVETSPLVIVMGQNPGTNHPRMLTALQACRRNGGEIVSINPLPEVGLAAFRHPQKPGDLVGAATPLAGLHLPVRIGGDIALLKQVMQHLDRLDQAGGDIFDRAFIEDHTEGFEAFLDDLRGQAPERLADESGIPDADARRLATLIAERSGMIVCWAMGLTQHRHGVANVREIVNLLLLRGAIGRPGAGACPVRGHSNVQGDRTVGIVERPKPAMLAAMREHFGFEPPSEPGYATVEAIEAMERGDVDVFVALGGNWLSATPDTDRVAAGLARCRLTVHISTKPNRTHLIPGERSLILPCLGRSERDEQASGPQFVTVENSMGIVHASRGDRRPAGPGLRSEPWIVSRLGAALEAAGAIEPTVGLDWSGIAGDYAEIRRHIEAVVPGFEDYEGRIARPDGFSLPNGPRERDFSGVPGGGGRARFTVNGVPSIDDPPGTLRMMTIRSHDQFNTTVYGLDDRYRGIRGERRVVFMSAEDLAARGITPGDRVDLESEAAGRVRRVESWIALDYPIPAGCCATYFPEANPLVPLEVRAEGSLTPASKLVHIRVGRRDDANGRSPDR